MSSPSDPDIGFFTVESRRSRTPAPHWRVPLEQVSHYQFVRDRPGRYRDHAGARRGGRPERPHHQHRPRAIAPDHRTGAARRGQARGGVLANPTIGPSRLRPWARRSRPGPAGRPAGPADRLPRHTRARWNGATPQRDVRQQPRIRRSRPRPLPSRSPSSAWAATAGRRLRDPACDQRRVERPRRAAHIVARGWVSPGVVAAARRPLPPLYRGYEPQGQLEQRTATLVSPPLPGDRAGAFRYSRARSACCIAAKLAPRPAIHDLHRDPGDEPAATARAEQCCSAPRQTPI